MYLRVFSGFQLFLSVTSAIVFSLRHLKASSIHLSMQSAAPCPSRTVFSFPSVRFLFAPAASSGFQFPLHDFPAYHNAEARLPAGIFPESPGSAQVLLPAALPIPFSIPHSVVFPPRDFADAVQSPLSLFPALRFSLSCYSRLPVPDRELPFSDPEQPPLLRHLRSAAEECP